MSSTVQSNERAFRGLYSAGSAPVVVENRSELRWFINFIIAMSETSQ